MDDPIESKSCNRPNTLSSILFFFEMRPLSSMHNYTTQELAELVHHLAGLLASSSGTPQWPIESLSTDRRVQAGAKKSRGELAVVRVGSVAEPFPAILSDQGNENGGTWPEKSVQCALRADFLLPGPFDLPRAHDADHGGAAALWDVSRHEHSVKTTVKPAPELKRSPILQIAR
jgi:hypothetical protein